jgi:hypothetical protein
VPVHSILKAAVPLLASCLLPAADLVVQPGNPSAYQTLQDALNAAQPGDRILLNTPLLSLPLYSVITITKSVTIEGIAGAPTAISAGPGPEILIQALTPGLPLTFRNLRLDLWDLGYDIGIRGLRTPNPLVGEIHFDQFSARIVSGFDEGNGLIADLRATKVWMRGCRFEAMDLSPDKGCVDIHGTDGHSCLKVSADTLHLEDCFLRAGSAIHLRYDCCGPVGGNCSGQFAIGGLGGTALAATTRNTTMVRCQISDGNGGTVENSPLWLTTVQAGAARPSTFGGQTGTLDTFEVSHELARPGALGAQYSSRGPTVAIGPAAPLVVGGPVTPGTFLAVTLNTAPGSTSVFGLGLGWDELPKALGTVWTVPIDVLGHSGGGTTQTYAIPAIPELRGMPIVTQALQLLPSLELLNPSGVAIR